jgi:hypothetical protein
LQKLLKPVLCAEGVVGNTAEDVQDVIAYLEHIASLHATKEEI